MSSNTENHEQGEAKLEDILKSIRGIIEDHNQNPPIQSADEPNYAPEDEDDEILELTSVVSSAEDLNTDEEIIVLSEGTQEKTKAQINRFSEKVKKSNYTASPDSLDSMVNELMRPLIKDWLDNNLPRIVEKVVSEEIRKMIPKS